MGHSSVKWRLTFSDRKKNSFVNWKKVRNNFLPYRIPLHMQDRTFDYTQRYHNVLIIWKKFKISHLPLTENRLKFFVPSNPTNNYENIYIWWHEIIKINLVSQALFEKTHFSVILYYKIDHFCPLNAIFTHFLPFDPMFGSGIHYYLVAIICWYK